MLVNHVRGTNHFTYYYPHPSLLDIIHMKDPNKTISIEARHDNPNTLLQLDINHNTIKHFMTPGVDQNFLQNYIYISALRGIITPNVRIGDNRQSIDPRGSNIIQFFLERFTDRDERWNEAEYWIRKIDPSLRLLKTPLRGGAASLESKSEYGIDINFAYQGLGIQNAVTIIAALVFSEHNATIVIEEPENHLNPSIQEHIADLINKAVMEWNKQVIFTTHSVNMILPYLSDVGKGKDRGNEHIKIDHERFLMIGTEIRDGQATISPIDINDRPLRHLGQGSLERVKDLL